MMKNIYIHVTSSPYKHYKPRQSSVSYFQFRMPSLRYWPHDYCHSRNCDDRYLAASAAGAAAGVAAAAGRGIHDDDYYPRAAATWWPLWLGLKPSLFVDHVISEAISSHLLFDVVARR